MKVRHLERELWLPRPIAEIFSFFANPANLEHLLGRKLGFERGGEASPHWVRAIIDVAFLHQVVHFHAHWLHRVEKDRARGRACVMGDLLFFIFIQKRYQMKGRVHDTLKICENVRPSRAHDGPNVKKARTPLASVACPRRICVPPVPFRPANSLT